MRPASAQAQARDEFRIVPAVLVREEGEDPHPQLCALDGDEDARVVERAVGDSDSDPDDGNLEDPPDLTIDLAGVGAKVSQSAVMDAQKNWNVARDEAKDAVNQVKDQFGGKLPKRFGKLPMDDPEALRKNLGGLPGKKLDTALHDGGVNSSGRSSKKANSFGLGVVAGWLTPVGGNFGAGIELGGNVFLGGQAKSNGVTARKVWSVEGKLRFGYFFGTNFMPYITGGLSVSSVKVDTSGIKKIVTQREDFQRLSEQLGEKEATQSFDLGRYGGYTKTRVNPIFGLGVMVEVTPSVAVFLEGQCSLGSKVTSFDQTGADVKLSARSVRLGVVFKK
jgi:opacity protein-like surface antigen